MKCKIVNFLEETLEFINDGKYEEDWMYGKITCVSIRKGKINYFMSWEQFKKLAANINYNIYSADLNEIPALSLKIWFEDGRSLGRNLSNNYYFYKKPKWKKHWDDEIPKNGWDITFDQLGEELCYTAAPALFDPTITDPKALIYPEYNSDEEC